MSSFYSSNEKKYNKYLTENKLREVNQEEQQLVTDAKLAQEFGLETHSSNIGRLTNRVINKLITKDLQPTKKINSNNILMEAINKGDLSTLLNIMKTIKPDNSAEQEVLRNISDKKILDQINKDNEYILYRNKVALNDYNADKAVAANLLDDILKNLLSKFTNNKEETKALDSIVIKADLERKNSGSEADTEQGSLADTEQGSLADVSNRGRPITITNLDTYYNDTIRLNQLVNKTNKTRRERNAMNYLKNKNYHT